MQLFTGISRNTQPKSYMLSLTEFVSFGISKIMHCGVFINMPYWLDGLDKHVYQTIHYGCPMFFIVSNGGDFIVSYKQHVLISSFGCFAVGRNADDEGCWGVLLGFGVNVV